MLDVHEYFPRILPKSHDKSDCLHETIELLIILVLCGINFNSLDPERILLYISSTTTKIPKHTGFSEMHINWTQCYA